MKLETIFAAHIRTLALTLRPSTVSSYRGAVRRFLSYLHAAFPHLNQLGQLRRDPHLLGFLTSLCDSPPPLSNTTRVGLLISLRRLLEDLSANGHPLDPDLIRPQDFPPLPHYLPRPLPLDDDVRLQQELRRTDNLPAWALLLMRATGIRIGECIDLPLDCLRQIGPDQWALLVPLGKLHSERLLPADADVRAILARMLALRARPPRARRAAFNTWLLPRRSASRGHWYPALCSALAAAARRAGCSAPVTPHQLRHTFATQMIRLGVSLPALMRLLGHKDIRMTLRYVLVTQQDLQREFHTARCLADSPHRMPELPFLPSPTRADLPAIRQALTATRHLLEMYRRQLADEKTRRTLQRIDHRLLAITSILDQFRNPEK
jgi:site-specific recombinase XerD